MKTPVLTGGFSRMNKGNQHFLLKKDPLTNCEMGQIDVPCRWESFQTFLFWHLNEEDC